MEGNIARRQAFNARREGSDARRQAFNARPEGAMSPQPRASERSERHPGLNRSANDAPPEGAKAMTETYLSLLLPPPGAFLKPFGLTQGVASLRSLALGWKLIAPSGRALNACHLSILSFGACAERLPPTMCGEASFAGKNSPTAASPRGAGGRRRGWNRAG